MRFISGLICGLLASASILALANEGESFVPENWNAGWDYPWSSAHGSPKLHKETNEPFLTPNIGDAYPLLDLAEITPLLTLNRQDIKSVCIRPHAGEDTPAFSTEVFLTPEARNRIADILSAKDGKQVAFRLFDATITAFNVDARKIASFKENADIYPGTPEWDEKYRTAKTEDEVLMLLNADLTFSSGPSNLYMGYTLTKYLTGTNELVTCEESGDPHDIPGYTEHLEYWNKTMEMAANGKTK